MKVKLVSVVQNEAFEDVTGLEETELAVFH